jgi:cytochrome c
MPVRAALLLMFPVLAGCGDAGARPRPQVAGGEAAAGKGLIAAYGCGSCHVIPGVNGATGRAGPPLTAFAERVFIAGRLRNEPENLVFWISNPQRVDPATAMPNLGVPDAEARHIAAYLYTLGSGGEGPPHLLPDGKQPGR